MTVDGRPPTLAHRDRWTAYERATANGTGFDYDACSCRHAPAADPTIRDVESLTLLRGLESD